MNVLIIGYGSIAKKHVDALSSLNTNLKIWALRYNKSSKAIEGVISIYNYEEIPKKIDFAIVSNPTSKHIYAINKLVPLKIPLFIEKPAFSSLRGTTDLLAQLKEKKILSYVACNLRFHPCIKHLKNKVEQETLKINEINIYCGSYLPSWRPEKDFKQSYSADSAMGGGVHLDLFHELDYATWIFGKPNKVLCTKRKASTLNIESVDYANYLLEYDTFTTSIILNYYRKDSKRTIEILLEDETLKIDLLKCNISNSNEEILYEIKNFNILATYKMQMKFFLDVLKEKTRPMNTLAESLEILKIAL